MQIVPGPHTFYEGVLRNSLKFAPMRWRTIFLTRDLAALAAATRKLNMTALALAEIKVRGLSATMWKITAAARASPGHLRRNVRCDSSAVARDRRPPSR